VKFEVSASFLSGLMGPNWTDRHTDGRAVPLCNTARYKEDDITRMF